MVVEIERPATSMHDKVFRALLIEAVRLWTRQLKREGGYNPQQCAVLAEQLGAEPLKSANALKSAREFNALAESIAHLSFAPGGCRAFGLRFEASPARDNVVNESESEVSA